MQQICVPACTGVPQADRMVYAPARAIPQGPFNPVNAGGGNVAATDEESSDDAMGEATGDDQSADSLSEDERRPLPSAEPLQGIRIQPVICGIVGDYPARAHWTNWQTQSAIHHGGWCMECLGKGSNVRPAAVVYSLNQKYVHSHVWHQVYAQRNGTLL